jgi:glycerophosphoryl diester phosphodiesterase
MGMLALDLPARPWIVGHRGVREEAPENTVASLRAAVAQKADMVELDLQLTNDDQLVLFHDPSIRVAKEKLEWVGRLTLEEIKRCRPVWGRKGQERAYEVSTLAEVLEAAPAGLPLNLEIKGYEGGKQAAVLADALAEAIAGREQILVSSFNGPVLAEVKKRLPDLPLAPLGGLTARWEDLVGLARRLDAFSIHIDRRLAGALARKGSLDEPRAKERPVLAYTVNRATEARRLLRSGVAGFFTDHPGELRGHLEGRK